MTDQRRRWWAWAALASGIVVLPWRDHGRPVYAMLDDADVDIFRHRYRDVGDVSWLDKPPLVTPANRVYLYLVAEGR